MSETFRSFFKGKIWVVEHNGRVVSMHKTQTGSENRARIEFLAAKAIGKSATATFEKRDGVVKNESHSATRKLGAAVSGATRR